MHTVFEKEIFFAFIGKEAKIINQYMREDLSRQSESLDSLLNEVLEYGLFNGGKRIRPLLVVIASRLCGGESKDVYKLGCAFEYLHAATLFHDDIIDNSETRRGKPSVFKKYGKTPAILAGDYLLALSMEKIGEYTGQTGLKIFCRAAAGMVDGEFLQLKNAQKFNLSVLDYHNVIMGKTALLIAAACEIGAIYGGGNHSQQQQLRNYGMQLGCAFQIVDDLLDYLGDPEKTGKPVGTDLLEGKVTLPLIIALNEGPEKDRSRLLEILQDDERRALGVAEVCGIIKRNRGFEKAREVARVAVQQASAALQEFRSNTCQEERLFLQQLTNYVVVRDT